jgi:hypothetical protein
MSEREKKPRAGARFRAIKPAGRRVIAGKQVPAYWILSVMIFLGTMAAARAEVVVDFEQAAIGKPVSTWTEKGVVFALAHAPTQTKAQGRVTFFPHLETRHKGILCAMAAEPIPVEARFPGAVSAVTIVFWASTGCAARLDAFDQEGRLLNEALLPVAPSRTDPGEPVPFFELSVHAPGIAFVRFSGPRAGEFLAADEVRFEPEK